MALRNPPRPAPAAAPAHRSGGAGKIVVAVLVVAALGIGYITLRPMLTGPRAQPTPSTLPGEFFDGYTTFFDQYGATLPDDLAVDQIRQWANEFAAGAMPNTPAFLPTDDLGRARGGWVCGGRARLSLRRWRRQRARRTEEPWPKRPWLAVTPTVAPST